MSILGTCPGGTDALVALADKTTALGKLYEGDSFACALPDLGLCVYFHRQLQKEQSDGCPRCAGMLWYDVVEVCEGAP